jgi:hypothetical protein
MWSRVDSASPRWEQAVAKNGAWETNWIADFMRVS